MAYQAAPSGGPWTRKVANAPGLTAMGALVPVRKTSVERGIETVMVCLPAVLSVTVKMAVSLVRLAVGGRTAWASPLRKESLLVEKLGTVFPYGILSGDGDGKS